MTLQRPNSWPKNLIQLLIGIVRLVIIINLVLFSITILTTFMDSSSPELTAWKIDLTRLVAWIAIGSSVFVGAQFLWLQLRYKDSHITRHMKRSNPWSFLFYQLFLALMFSYLLHDNPVLQQTLGLQLNWPLSASIGAGFFVYGSTVALHKLGCRLFTVCDQLKREEYQVLRFVWPRRRRALIPFLVAVCLLNPFTEEIMYRAILLPLLVELTDGVVSGALLALSCSVLVHLYQGWRLAFFHLLFHGAAIILFLSPAGLAGSIALHFAGDIVPVFFGAKLMRDRVAMLRVRHSPYLEA